MKRKRILHLSILLVALVLLLVPAKAEATEVSVTCPSYSFTAMDGTRVTNQTDAGNVKLIIFYGDSCGNSMQSVQGVANADWVTNTGLTVLAAEVQGSAYTELGDFADTYGNGGKDITFCAGGNSAMWNFLYRVGYSQTNVTLPVSFLVDSSGVIRHYATGYTTQYTYRDMLIGYLDGVEAPAEVTLGITGNYDYEEAFQVLTLLNEQRTANGLSKLTLDTQLLEAAMQRAAECSVYYSHTRPNGEKCYTVPGFIGSYRGENIAVGYGSAASVMVGWMNSEGHRNNILNSRFTSVGLGVFWHNGHAYWVQIFSDASGTAASAKDAVNKTAKVVVTEDLLTLKADYSELTMNPGGTVQLRIYTTNLGWAARDARIDADSLVFTSTNSKVVKVDSDGTVTAVSGGSAEIQVSAVGGTQKVVIPVKVAAVAAITKQPVGVCVKNGAKATVKVEAVGDGLTYQWYYKDVGDSGYTYTSAFKGNTYSVTMTDARAGRRVMCRITDQYGNTVQTRSVPLNQKVKITKQPVSVAVPAGEKATVTVKASGQGLTYRWYYKDVGDSGYTYTSSFKGNTYSVTMTEARAGRRVLCNVYDKFGNRVQSKTVVLGMAAKITKQPVSVAVPAGEKATVTVKASGQGLTYRWYYKDVGDSGYTYTSAFKGNTYSVTMTEARAGRRVLCNVYDKFGNRVQSKTVVLGMAAKITKQPVSTSAAYGEKVTVSVKAAGDGLTYRWYYKDVGDSGYTYTSAFKGNTYSVTMTEARAGRRVLCRVTDQYGNTVQSNSAVLKMK